MTPTCAPNRAVQQGADVKACYALFKDDDMLDFDNYLAASQHLLRGKRQYFHGDIMYIIFAGLA